MIFQQFKERLNLNPNYSSYNAKALSKIFGITEEEVKDYRKKLKEEKKYSTFEGSIDKFPGIPSEEELELIGYKLEANKKVPVAPDNYIISSYKLDKFGNVDQQWLKRDEEGVNSLNEIDWNQIAKTISRNTKPIKLTPKNNSKVSKLVCITDVHAGMATEGWGKSQMLAAFQKVGDSINNCDDVTILMLGDGIDGLCKQTVRGGHKLPQDMNNQEQILSLVESFQLLFDILAEKVKQGSINSFNFESVYESNHSGDMDYVVGKFLEMWLKVKYPDVDCHIITGIWGGFTINDINFWYTHGKDAENAKYGLGMNLNEKTELYLTHMLKQTFLEYDLNPRKNIVVSGDLHTESFSQGKFFKYYKVPAMSPSSNWVKANFGYSIPGVQYFNIHEDSTFETGIIEL